MSEVTHTTEEEQNLYPDTNNPENTGVILAGGVIRNPDGTIKKGSVSLNPQGKPKGALHWSTRLKQKLDAEADATLQAKPEYDKHGVLIKKDKMDLVAEKLVDLAIAGDMQAIKEIGDRVDGKARQSIQIKTNEVVRFDPKKYKEIEELWYGDDDEDEEDEENKTPEETPAQAMANAEVTQLQKEPDYVVEPEETDADAGQ